MKKAYTVPDDTYPNMYRVRWPDGSLSDMVNLSRANDAAARFNETMRRNGAGEARAAPPMSSKCSRGSKTPTRGYYRIQPRCLTRTTPRTERLAIFFV